MRENFLPISIDTIHENQLDLLIIEGKMLRDFGLWKKDEELTLIFNFEIGKCSQLNSDGETVKSVDFELKVV